MNIAGEPAFGQPHTAISAREQCHVELLLKPLDLDWSVMAAKEKEWMQHWDENIKGKGKK